MPAVSHCTQSATWSAYQRAIVDIAFPAHRIRISPGSSHRATGLAYPIDGARTIHIVTAFNPGGRLVSAHANLRAQHELLQILDRRGLRWWPAVGGDLANTHAEISAAVVGLDDAEARALGRSFGQDAVFAWSPTSWRLLACADTAHDTVMTDWQATLVNTSAS
ncbi:DUF3293 domain-containing protein [Streptomyces sp. NPDC004561]